MSFVITDLRPPELINTVPIRAGSILCDVKIHILPTLFSIVQRVRSHFCELTPSIYLRFSAILSYIGGESTSYKARFYILLQQLSILFLKG